MKLSVFLHMLDCCYQCCQLIVAFESFSCVTANAPLHGNVVAINPFAVVMAVFLVYW